MVYFTKLCVSWVLDGACSNANTSNILDGLLIACDNEWGTRLASHANGHASHASHSANVKNFYLFSLFQAPRETREGKGVSLGAWNRLLFVLFTFARENFGGIFFFFRFCYNFGENFAYSKSPKMRKKIKTIRKNLLRFKASEKKSEKNIRLHR